MLLILIGFTLFSTRGQLADFAEIYPILPPLDGRNVLKSLYTNTASKSPPFLLTPPGKDATIAAVNRYFGAISRVSGVACTCANVSEGNHEQRE
jgi:hypothetical protein